MERERELPQDIVQLFDNLSALGRRILPAFFPEAMRSNVPPEFFTAVRNYTQGILPKTFIKIDQKATVRHLLGVDCRTDDEASYVLSRANAISIVKQLAQQREEGTFDQELQERCEEMLGVVDYYGDRVDHGTGRLCFIFRLRNITGSKTGSRSKVLSEQMEKNLKDHAYRARILLLAAN